MKHRHTLKKDGDKDNDRKRKATHESFYKIKQEMTKQQSKP